jgi:cell wall-associated NlpC family hydrolase
VIVRVRTLSSAFFCSVTILAVPATPALAGASGPTLAGGASPGGASPSSPSASGGSTPTGSPTAAAPIHRPALHLAPVTARSSKLLYKGPVFQKTATGAIVPYQPGAPAVPPSGPTGGSPVGVIATAVTKPELLVPGSLARYVNGLAAAPMSAPAAVQQVIWAANQIIGLPYVYGGGHGSFSSPGYDCSGTVSFALHGASLLATPADSSEFMVWGSHGVGRWVTIFSNPGHAYVDVAGLRLDTSAADDPSNQQGPRWRPLRPANSGFTVRHPLAL